ncbi:SagB family peptide dehydrogenase [Lysinibacillus sp. 1 U-2021]|uniref:SagB family peptide dehydrogenase n=1 Tax=Lysinibacillus sp. 1 U-2021 TaxID=3039426 RepID=UPI0024805205|nr:SagB family peptide dehydrogenase [Lysinibacillus sp. 1 U-2021]WGT40304.1 SagB family peptide dehydrogenase [Lysinibacillus sp. 1 U-2021]
MMRNNMNSTVLWDTEVDRSLLRRTFHSKTISRKDYTSVQIKKVKTKKKWETKPGIFLHKRAPQNDIEKLLVNRRTRRYPSNREINIQDISEILQFAAGITDEKNKYFSYPSPGALYPCTLFLSINLAGFKEKIYRYNPYKHQLEEYADASIRSADSIIIDINLKKFPVKIFFTSDYQLLEEKYGELSYRLLNQEIGHIAQNISLYSEFVGLNTTCIGGFYEEEFKRYIPEYDLLYAMVVG